MAKLHQMKVHTFFFLLASGESFYVSPTLILVAFAFTPAMAQTNDTATNQTNPSSMPGSSVAASDLYGIGVRVGFYLQTLGMSFNCIAIMNGEKTAALGIKLAASSNIIAILISWTILVRQKEISPAEARLVLGLLGLFLAPGLTSLLNSQYAVEESVGMALLLVSIVWVNIANLWFWASLYRELPALGTAGRVWYFTSVSVTGWYRTYMLVAFSIITITTMTGVIWILILWFNKEARNDEEMRTPGAVGYGFYVFMLLDYWNCGRRRNYQVEWAYSAN